MVDVVTERVAGIDIGKRVLVVCVRTRVEPGTTPPTSRARAGAGAGGGQSGRPGRRGEGDRVRGGFREQVRSFQTTTRSLLQMADWLSAEQVTVVAMESTGQFWRPVFYLLENLFQTQLVNPAHIKNVPGRKSDVNDAVWIAQLVQHGLVRASLVPPPPIRRLRDLTRLRTSLVQDRTRLAQRLQDVLEDAGIKLSSVATDILGVSARHMIETLIIDNDADPAALADLARGRMRSKTASLAEALTGRFSSHHGLQCQLLLGHIDHLNTSITALDTRIDEMITTDIETQMHTHLAAGPTSPGTPGNDPSTGTGEGAGAGASPVGEGVDAMAPFRDLAGLRDLLDTIPGVGHRTAEVLIAETGADMTRFPSPTHLASWAAMCPGQNESAGRHGSTHTRQGNSWLRGALGEAAQAAARTKNTYLAERHHRLARRRGTKRAVVATGRHILEITYTITQNRVPYTDLGPDYHTRRRRHPQQRINHLVQELLTLGYTADLKPIPSPT